MADTKLTNNIKPFIDTVNDDPESGNVENNTTYQNDIERQNGYQPNTEIHSKIMNTVLRQVSLVCSAFVSALKQQVVSDLSQRTLDTTTSITDATSIIQEALGKLLVERATNDGNGNNIVNTYQTKSDANSFSSALTNGTTAVKKADQLSNARTFTFTGNASGSTSFDGTQNVTINLTVSQSANATTASNVATNINGKAISSIFESDGITAKKATTSSSCSGNAATASKLATARTFTFSGDVSGSVSFDGSSPVTVSLSCSHATNADLASVAVKMQQTSVGNATTPVFLNSNGQFQAVTTTANATNATNVTTNINGKAISNIFETDGITAKKSTSLVNSSSDTSASLTFTYNDISNNSQIISAMTDLRSLPYGIYIAYVYLSSYNYTAQVMFSWTGFDFDQNIAYTTHTSGNNEVIVIRLTATGPSAFGNGSISLVGYGTDGYVTPTQIVRFVKVLSFGKKISN